MSKKHRSIGKLGVAVAGVLLLSGVPAAAQLPCAPGAGGAAVQVRFVGLKDRGGTVRAQLYGDNPDTFLDKGARLSFIEAPVPAGGVAALCVQLPRPGSYALFGFHDRNGNGKKEFSVDGFGFSRNPRMRLGKPDLADTLVQFRAGVETIDIVMNYRNGLASIGPVKPSR